MRDLTEEKIAEAVLKSIANTKNPRLKELFTCLIKHLHEFVREVELTQGEWAAAIDFLYRAGKISSPKRQEFILLSDTLGVSSLVDLINGRGPAGTTETSVFGPFYVEGSKILEVGGDLIIDSRFLLVRGFLQLVGATRAILGALGVPLLAQRAFDTHLLLLSPGFESVEHHPVPS